jgi:hypothetical protein
MSMTKAAKANEKLMASFQDVMSTNSGRDVLNHIISQSGIGQSAFKGQSNGTIFNCGMQAIGIQISQLAQDTSPELHLQMIKERLNNE